MIELKPKIKGVDIWVVAGSIKINPNGEILRFTGIPKKVQQTFEPHTSNTANPIDFPAFETV